MKKFTVLDIGSSKIRIAILELNSKNYNICGYGESEYAGFCEGEFLEEDNLQYAIGMAIRNAEESSNYHVKNLYVALPAEFLTISNKTATLQFDSKKKVLSDDITLIKDQANDFKYNNDLTLIDVASIEYILDNGKKLKDPVGHKTEKITANLSYQLADTVKINLLNKIFEQLGMISVEYLSAPLCQCLYLIDENVRKDYTMLIDCGYITTHVAIAKGNGLLYLGSFSVGGGHVMADLAECLKIGYNDAETLKRKLVLTVNDNSQIYELPGGLNVPATVASEITSSRIDMICQIIDKCIEISNINYPKYFPVYLTGGGISMIKGAKEEVAKNLGRNVQIVNGNLPQFTKPFTSSLVALCECVFNRVKDSNKSFLSRLFK